MFPRPKLDQPPQSAAWLLGLFAAGDKRDLIIGDLSEEYFQRTSLSGRAPARRWYWRQILKSLPHLVGSAFRTAPWTTVFAVVAGFEFRRLIGPRMEPAIFALIDRWQIYEHHYGTYRFLASTGLDIGHLMTYLLVGALVAFIARRSEMAPAVALGLIYAGMTVVGSVWFVLKSHEFAYLLRLSWYFSDALAVVVGAALVRIFRSNRTRLTVQ